MMFSCLQGYALTTYEELVNALGEPDYKRQGTYSQPTLEDGDGKVYYLSALWFRGQSFSRWNYRVLQKRNH